jgi:hypothetical protein
MARRCVSILCASWQPEEAHVRAAALTAALGRTSYIGIGIGK